jgi:hypothetical protein
MDEDVKLEWPEDSDMEVRIEVIRKAILDVGQKLKDSIPTDLVDADIIKNDEFKLCMIATLILNNMENVTEETSDFNRVLYYMFNTCGSVLGLLNQYDLAIKTGEDGNISFELIVLETEFTENE